MPKRDGDDYIVSETGNWNVADDYSKKKIMRPLILCDYYEDIAYFGYESIAEELVNYTSPPNDVIRYSALKRLIKTLIRLIDNSKFALKKSGTRNKALKYKKMLIDLQRVLPRLIRVTTDQIAKTRNFRITNYSLFEDIIKQVAEIKSMINEPLNQNHLIFTDKEEFDPKKFKENIKRRMIEEG